MPAKDDPLLGWLDDPAPGRGARFYRGRGQWQRIPYPELARRAFGAAREFRDAGIRRGDLVMTTARTTPPYLLCWLALASLGAVTVFAEDMTAGRGWIAVVVVMLGRGHPVYSAAACALTKPPRRRPI